MEDKIRELCQQAVEERDSAKAEALLHQLSEAIHVHIEELRGRIATYPVVQERRASVELDTLIEGAD
jgi:cell fate (sporulation/competence/biofilm development) regulator YmcA (YheA/YmcA/DUF963 family)